VHPEVPGVALGDTDDAPQPGFVLRGMGGMDAMADEQGVPLFTSVLRFTGPECLQDWLGSETRRQLVAEISPLLLEDEALELNP
ncbi:hypothetical protein R0G64_31210, partial [Pseudomonas otitidis]|nr:hypothetical protein [Pseudomonas otitidis]